MVDHTGGTRADPGAGQPGAARRWSVLLPALSLLVGVLLGVGGTLAATSGSAGRAPTATSSSAPEKTVSPATAPSGRTLTIPASCERGLDRAEAAMNTLGEAVQAIRDLQSARLQERLNQLQQAQQDVDALAAQCRREAHAATLPPPSSRPSGSS